MTELDVTTRSSIALSILVMNVARIAARSLCQFWYCYFQCANSRISYCYVLCKAAVEEC